MRGLALFLCVLPLSAAAGELAPIHKALLGKDFGEAERLAREAVPMGGPEARYLLAVALTGQGKHDEAALTYARAARDPAASTRLRSRALYANALAQMARLDFAAAVNAWTRYLELAMTSPADRKFVPIVERELERCRKAVALNGEK